ncbi:MAG: hypothetical protein ACOCZK_03555 [Planctomycetota bacterium]
MRPLLAACLVLIAACGPQQPREVAEPSLRPQVQIGAHGQPGRIVSPQAHAEVGRYIDVKVVGLEPAADTTYRVFVRRDGRMWPKSDPIEPDATGAWSTRIHEGGVAPGAGFELALLALGPAEQRELVRYYDIVERHGVWPGIPPERGGTVIMAVPVRLAPASTR